jgi:hypothetical protein
MKISLTSLLLCLTLSLTLASTSVPARASDTGQVDLAPLAATMDATPKVNLAFGPAMMAGFAETMRQNNPELADILKSVRGLRVMVYEGIDNTGAQDPIVELVNRLGAQGWSPALTVRDDTTKVDLLLIESDQYVNGLTLLVRDGKSTAVFANIHGNLDPVVIGRLIGSGKAMGDFSLEGLMGHIQGEDPNRAD